MSEVKSLCEIQLPMMERLPNDSESLADDFDRYLTLHLGRFTGCIPFYLYEAFALTMRDRIMADWRNTWKVYEQHNQGNQGQSRDQSRGHNQEE